MAASPSSVLTRGLGSWSDVSLLVTHGFGVASVPVITPSVILLSQVRDLVLDAQSRPLVLQAEDR